MNLVKIKGMLEEHGNSCLRLAGKLCDVKGYPIGREDKDLIRVAVISIIKEETAIMQAAFVLNDVKGYKRSLDTIEDLFQQLK